VEARVLPVLATTCTTAGALDGSPRNYDIHKETCESRELYRMLLSLLRPFFMLLAFSVLLFPILSLSPPSSSFIVSFNIYFFSINLYDFPTYVRSHNLSPLRQAERRKRRKKKKERRKR
jgi:hypothetical protein